MDWQWHQRDHMQIICTSLQIVPHHSAFTGRMPFLPPNQQHQSTEILHNVQINVHCKLSIEQHFETGHAKVKFSPVNTAPDVPGQKLISGSIKIKSNQIKTNL